MKFTPEQQNAVVRECVETGASLAEKLSASGHSFDDLVYETPAAKKRYPKFVPVRNRPALANGIPCVSFFSGAGGLDIGFESAGYTTIANVELNPMFCDTLRANGHKTIVGPPDFTGDINDYGQVIADLESLGISRDFPGVFHGGPPCQSFSVAANQRFSKSGENFKRTGFNNKKLGNLLFCYVKIIAHFRPEVFLIENVDGLLSIDDGGKVSDACSILRDAGYLVTPPRVVNAADYGVPQKRMRTLIVGSRIGQFEFPPKCGTQIPAGSVLQPSLKGVANHQTREHNAASIQRYMRLQVGKRDKLGRVDRLDPDKPSKTIIAGGMRGGGRSHLHPQIPRTMSVRECARLQTFPDDHVFTGPIARQFTQVGNAVPPVLAYEMACAIYRSIYQAKK